MTRQQGFIDQSPIGSRLEFDYSDKSFYLEYLNRVYEVTRMGTINR